MSEPCLFVGVDEAGYGPSLGPLVVGCVAFEGTAAHAGRDWWAALEPVVQRATAAGSISSAPLVVDDSKKVLARSSGRRQLCRTVHAFARLIHSEMSRLTDVVGRLAPKDSAGLRQEHWFSTETDIPTSPSDDVGEDARRLKVSLAGAGLKLHSLQARMLFPRAFNELLAALGTKAAVEIELIHDLLQQVFLAEPRLNVRVAVDRLGGRRYYRPLVEDLAGDAFVSTVEETSTRSRYRFSEANREIELLFQVQGDRHHFPVALASMIAKHLRELCMMGFNQFWQSHLPDLAPTAGYPMDAARFMAAIEPFLGPLQIDRSHLRRAK